MPEDNEAPRENIKIPRRSNIQNRANIILSLTIILFTAGFLLGSTLVNNQKVSNTILGLSLKGYSNLARALIENDVEEGIGDDSFITPPVRPVRPPQSPTTPPDIPRSFPPVNSCRSVYKNDFDTQTVGWLTPELLNETWNRTSYALGVSNRRVRIVSSRTTNFLRVTYPQGSVGPEQGGALWVLRLNKQYEELYASYNLRFRPGFEFALGGKLPGLAGGQGNTGGLKPNGLDGWSARAMWTRDGKAIQYVYHPDQPGTYGQSMVWKDSEGQPIQFIPGRWYHIETRVVMNTPGQRNGIIQTWLNGQKVLDRNDLRFRDTDSFGIDQFQFSTFFGGDEPRHAARKTEYTYFDNFVISTCMSGV